MNKNEFERMISLADERYIDEMFEDRLYGKRKNIFFGIGAVAAALVIICGAGFIAANMDGAGDISETMPNGFIATSPDDFIVDEAVDYSRYFRNKSENLISDYYFWVDDTAKTIAFDNEYINSILPFAAEEYSGSGNQSYVYCDSNDDPYGVLIYLSSEFDEAASPKFKSVRLSMSVDGTVKDNYPLDGITPIKRFDTDIYGFDVTEWYGSDVYDICLKAYFAVDGTEYAVETANLSYDEIGGIIDKIIQSGFSIKNVNITGGQDFNRDQKDVSLAEANTIAPFAGYVPQESSLAGTTLWLYRGVTCVTQTENDEITSQLMVFTFQDFADGYITCYYYTNDETPYDNVIDINDITREALAAFDDNGERNFTVDCGSFMINIMSRCDLDELFTFMRVIRGDVCVSNDLALLVDTSLSAANKIQPFAGYVPQLERFGDMKLSAVSKGYLDGNASPSLLHMVYVDDLDNPKKMLTAHFYSDYKAVFLDEPTVSAVPLSELSLEKINSLGKSFIMDCGEFNVLIGANPKCTSADVWAYVSAINPNAAEEEERRKAEALETDSGDTQNILTIDKIKELAKKGYELTWSDFDGYDFEDMGSGFYIRLYVLENGYTLSIGGDSTDEKPMYIYLDSMDGRIDIRYESIEDFLSGNNAEKAEQDRLHAEKEEQQRISTGDAAIDRLRSGDGDLTLETLKKLAKKGDELNWSDFEDFRGTEVGSGLFIMAYTIEGTDYYVYVGGSYPGEKPWYIYLINKNDDSRIDIRYESIDDFLSGNTQNILTIDKIKELAKKGDSLMWSDFDGYDFEDMGSGIYARVYAVEDGYSLIIGGGSLDEKPMYIRLGSDIRLSSGGGNYIDIRYDSIDDFLNGNNT